MSEAEKRFVEEILEDASVIKSQLEYDMYDYDIIYAGLCSKKNSSMVATWVEENLEALKNFFNQEQFATIINKLNELKVKNSQEEENREFKTR